MNDEIQVTSISDIEALALVDDLDVGDLNLIGKVCPKCKTWKRFTEYSRHKGKNNNGYAAHCKECVKIYYNERGRRLAKIWEKENPDKIKRYAKKSMNNVREKFLEMYGGKCECCGENEKTFLVIDHVHGQAGIKEKESTWMAMNNAIKEFGSGKYRILCHNCNHAVRFGICPHQLENQNER